MVHTTISINNIWEIDVYSQALQGLTWAIQWCLLLWTWKNANLFSDTVMNINSHSGSTYESTVTHLGDLLNVEAVFVKDMAYFVESNYEHITGSGLSTYTHTFLIRRPDKAIYIHSTSVGKAFRTGSFTQMRPDFLVSTNCLSMYNRCTMDHLC